MISGLTCSLPPNSLPQRSTHLLQQGFPQINYTCLLTRYAGNTFDTSPLFFLKSGKIHMPFFLVIAFIQLPPKPVSASLWDPCPLPSGKSSFFKLQIKCHFLYGLSVHDTFHYVPPSILLCLLPLACMCNV